jgi:uncharacterized membrane protein
MTDLNLALVAATYPDVTSAAEDYEALEAAEKDQDFVLVGAVVVSRGEDGEVTVHEHGAASPVGGEAVIGGGAGFVIGLFAPPLLLATALGAGIGAGIGALVKRHQEKEMGVELREYLPEGSSAVIAVVDDTYADRVDRALTRASKKVRKAVDSGDAAKLEKALAEASEDVGRAVDS